MLEPLPREELAQCWKDMEAQLPILSNEIEAIHTAANCCAGHLIELIIQNPDGYRQLIANMAALVMSQGLYNIEDRHVPIGKEPTKPNFPYVPFKQDDSCS